MNPNLIDKMTTDYYKVLKILYDNQVKLKESKFVPLTQVEVSEKLGVSKTKVHFIFKDLQENILIYPYQSGRGRYCLSDKAKVIIEKIEELNSKIKG